MGESVDDDTTDILDEVKSPEDTLDESLEEDRAEDRGEDEDATARPWEEEQEEKRPIPIMAIAAVAIVAVLLFLLGIGYLWSTYFTPKVAIHDFTSGVNKVMPDMYKSNRKRKKIAKNYREMVKDAEVHQWNTFVTESQMAISDLDALLRQQRGFGETVKELDYTEDVADYRQSVIEMNDHDVKTARELRDGVEYIIDYVAVLEAYEIKSDEVELNRPGEISDVSSVMSHIGQTAQETAKHLQDLNPPPPLVPMNDEMVWRMNRLAKLSAETVEALDAIDLDSLKELENDLSRVGRKIHEYNIDEDLSVMLKADSREDAKVRADVKEQAYSLTDRFGRAWAPHVDFDELDKSK